MGGQRAGPVASVGRGFTRSGEGCTGRLPDLAEASGTPAGTSDTPYGGGPTAGLSGLAMGDLSPTTPLTCGDVAGAGLY